MTIFPTDVHVGLDSGSASELVSVLRTLAHEPGIVDVVVLTIHRPGQDLLELFDKVVLLYDGKVHSYIFYMDRQFHAHCKLATSTFTLSVLTQYSNLTILIMQYMNFELTTKLRMLW